MAGQPCFQNKQTNRFETEVKSTRLNPINQRREPYVSGKQKVESDIIIKPSNVWVHNKLLPAIHKGPCYSTSAESPSPSRYPQIIRRDVVPTTNVS